MLSANWAASSLQAVPVAAVAAALAIVSGLVGTRSRGWVGSRVVRQAFETRAEAGTQSKPSEAIAGCLPRAGEVI